MRVSDLCGIDTVLGPSVSDVALVDLADERIAGIFSDLRAELGVGEEGPVGCDLCGTVHQPNMCPPDDVSQAWGE